MSKMFQFLWTAPPRGSGCINFKAMVEERPEVWYTDYGSLTYALCEDDSPLAEPPVRFILKERAKFVQIQSTVRVPKIVINVGGCFGDDLFTMCGPSFNPTFYFMWPRARLFKGINEEGEKSLCTEKSVEKVELKSSQFWTSRNTSDGIILPQNTRKIVGKCLYLSTLNYVKNRELCKLGHPKNNAVFRM